MHSVGIRIQQGVMKGFLCSSRLEIQCFQSHLETSWLRWGPLMHSSAALIQYVIGYCQELLLALPLLRATSSSPTSSTSPSPWRASPAKMA
jgi:hypothetical protein